MKDFVIATEELATTLRMIRRDNPELFYDLPAERLYRSIEDALDAYHRSRLQSQSQWKEPNEKEG